MAEQIIYASCFDEDYTQCAKNQERSRITLQNLQNYANDRLRTNGYLSINELHQMIINEVVEIKEIV